jgi:hypothetical protein
MIDQPDFLSFIGAKNKKELLVDELNLLEPIKLPNDAWRDHKKLTKFLSDCERTVNKQITGMKKLMDTIADEILARPTYSETYFNFRLNCK